MPTVADELVTVLGFDIKSGAGAVLTKFGQGIESIAAKAKVVSAVVISAAAAVGYFVEKSNSATAEFYKLKDLTGLSAKALQDWSYAAEQAGGSAQDIQRDLVALEKALHPTMPGEYNEGLFQLLGPDYLQKYRTVKDTLYAVSDAIKGMPKGLALNYLAMSNISESSYHLLKRGRAGVDELMKGSPFALTDEQIEKAFKFEQSMNRMKTIITRVGQALAADLSPYFTEVLTKLEKFVRANGKLIELKLKEFIAGVGDGFQRFGGLINKAIDLVDKLVPGVKDLVKNLSVKELTSDGVYLGLTALAVGLLLVHGRTLLVTGAIVGLIAGFQKLQDMNVEDSKVLKFFRQLVDDTVKIKNAISDAFQPIMDFFKPLMDFLAVRPEEMRPAKLLDENGKSKQQAMRDGDSHLLRDMMKSVFDVYRSWSSVRASAFTTPNWAGVGPANASNSSTTNNSPTYNTTVNVATPEQARVVLEKPNFVLQSPTLGH